MIIVYINYPDPHIAIHGILKCGNIQSHKKLNQRYLHINPETISTELQNFINKYYDFGSTPENNDMWLEINFQDVEFELSVINYIHRTLGKRYKRFLKIKPDLHCNNQIYDLEIVELDSRKSSKYAPLKKYLLDISIEENEITLNFTDVEQIINNELPMSAYKHRAWWGNEKNGVHVSAKAWMSTGWKVDTVNQKEQWVRFCRQS